MALLPRAAPLLSPADEDGGGDAVFMPRTALLLSPAAHCMRRNLSLWPIAIKRSGHRAANRVSLLRRAEQHRAAACAAWA